MSYLSDFPNDIDEFVLASDINKDDIDNANEYKELLSMTSNEIDNYGEIAWQDRVEELAGILEGKVLSADNMNKVYSAIENMQDFILTNKIHISNTAPTNPPTNKLWIDTSS